MELLLRLITAPGSGDDIVLSIDQEHTVAEVTHALAAYAEQPARDTLSVSRSGMWEQFYADQTIGELGLVSGDTVALGSYATGHQRETTGLIRLAVTSGPNAGQSFELVEGEHSLGRSADAAITLDDPMISRFQMTVGVASDGAAYIKPNPEAANKLRINGETQLEPVMLEANDVAQIGASRLRVREATTPKPRERDYFGGVPFHRTPYFRSPIPAKLFDAMGKLPVKPVPRRFQVLAAMAPMIMGVTMALVLGSWRYLMMAFFSPVVAAGNWWDQRKQGGIEYDEAIERFDDDLAVRKAEVAEARQIERMVRVQNNPDLELLARRADSKHNELWQRDRYAEDFLSLRVGVGSGDASLQIKPEPRGDEEYRKIVDEAFSMATTLPDIPISIDLADLGVLALVGERSEANELAAALLLQSACLHSPEDLVVLAALGPDYDLLDWLKWLPHTRASSSPVAGEQLVADSAKADDLLRQVAKIAEERASHGEGKLDHRWPWLVVAIDQSLEPDAGIVSRLLDLSPRAGISIIWLTRSHTRVPRQAKAVVALQQLRSAELSQVRFVDVERAPHELDPERLSFEVAASVAKSLAPMRDATAANAVTAIPRMVPLFAALDVSSMTPEWVAEQWDVDRGYALVAPIGMTESGPISLDLVEHGPHGLIGGTSGAGKSELVQSLVVNLAACNSPERINFLFVDYKGGALSEMFKPLPHTVGAVTNLDPLLALRALTSLTAELDRRMELFKGRATDIKEMIAKHPHEAPPSLVIVVDEFAALVRELPEFVDGIVSIAERGRSLGIHLLMSTQRPSGAINDNIQQNTNLRIALRMLDAGESNNVIGSPQAAMIPGPLKGRGLARLGPGELIPFQSAWSGAPLLAEQGPPPASVRPFAVGKDGRQRTVGGPAPSAGQPNRTQLDATVEAIVAAAENLGLERGRAPWKEVLSSHIPLGELLDDPRSRQVDEIGNRVTIGMIDDPAAQDQYPGNVDFGEAGAMVIFGNGGSGKSTLLKTVAASAAARDSENGGGGLTIFALDFASRELGLLTRLPQTSAVVTGDDLEGVTRVLALLGDQMEARRNAMATATASGDVAPEFVSILLLIDGYGNLTQAFEGGGQGRSMLPWLDLANELIVDGRTYGINVAFTAARRGAVRSSVMSAVSNRFILRQSDDSGYTELGVPSKMARGLELEPGQGFNEANQSMRFASIASAPSTLDAEPGDKADRAAERAAMIELGQGLIGGVAPELVTQPLPTELATMDPTGDEVVANVVRMGLADRSLAAVDLDLTYNNVAVIGPPRSGKSTALVTIGRQLISQGVEVWVAGPRGSLLEDLDRTTQGAFGRLDKLMPFFEELAVAIETFPKISRALLYDDVELVDDRKMYEFAQKIVDSDTRYVGSVSTLRGIGSNPFFAELKASRTQLVMQPVGPREVQEVTGVLPDIRPGTAMPVGRGVLIADRMPTVVQTTSHQIPDSGLAFHAAKAGLTPMPARQPLFQQRPSAEPAAPPQHVAPVQTPATQTPAAQTPATQTPPATLPPEPHTPAAAVPPATMEVPAVAPAPVAEPQLDLVLDSGERVDLATPLVVGRRPGDTGTARSLTLHDPTMSARHLVIESFEGTPYVTDQQSRNGTVVCSTQGTTPLQPGVPHALENGDEIRAGEMILMIRSADLPALG